MTIISKLESMNKEQKDLDIKKINLKEEFEYFIKDKNVPLYDRWNAFWIADEKLKNNLDGIPENKFKYLKAEIENMVNMPECYGRGRTIHTEDFFWDSYEEETKTFFPGGYDTEDKLSPGKEFSNEEMKNSKMFCFMEEILELNLWSFVFDW